MKSVKRRRGGWDFEETPVPAPSSEIRSRRGSVGFHSVSRPLLGTLLLVVALAAGMRYFHVIDFKAIPIPTRADIASRSMPILRSAFALVRPSPAVSAESSSSPVAAPASPQSTSLPTLHNSPDTTCGDHRQCSDAEFAGLIEDSARQWALVPQEIKDKCATNPTYPSLEHCVLGESVPWMEKHPNDPVPWINPKNFDAAIMALCKKNPKALSLCSKP